MGRLSSRMSAVIVAVSLVIVVLSSLLSDEVQPRIDGGSPSPEGVYVAFLRDVKDRSDTSACALLTSPHVLGYASSADCARAYAAMTSVFAPDALQRAISSGADVRISGDHARVAPRTPCLGVALMHRTPRGWQMSQPPFAPAPVSSTSGRL
jgi:hypothetical protein